MSFGCFVTKSYAMNYLLIPRMPPSPNNQHRLKKQPDPRPNGLYVLATQFRLAG